MDGGDLDTLKSFVGYARTANRNRIDIVTMLWDDDVNNIARLAQGSVAAWDEINAHERAQEERDRKSRGWR